MAQMCAALREASAGGFPPPATRAARALSCRCPPRPSPGRQLRPAPRPQPLSQLSLGWGRAAGEQLQGLGGRVGCPRNGRKQAGGRGPGGGVLRCGGAGRRGRGWSAPPPLPQRIWPGQLRGADPRSKPPPGFKGRPAGGAGGGAAGSTLRASPLSQHPGPLSRGETPPSKLASGFLHSCSHPPTQGPVVVTVPPSQTPSVSPI